ncbi:PLP-dependent aminotransferase family protein [Oleisolibacter albus]|uniref:MocR-like pyridoxine biosynthesis transcription factor PdxR n=1 Tax=Oleisolibacter albus TaxID=2171757 RepID=UPI00139007FE|nr:PLP-dependent aminotransferase family protein [Oleisolibacter albus]
MKISQGPLLSLFDADGSQPLQQQLFDRLRGAIVAGALRPGDRLPSTRTLSRDLGVSRNTVVAATDRLAAEGYLEARIGSGTYVARSLPDDAMAPPLRLARPTPSPRPLPPPTAAAELLPFRPAVPAYDQFEIETWRRLLAKRWRDAGGLLLGHDTGGGWLPLRRVLASHLQTSRGLSCDAEQILVLPGRTASLDFALGLLAVAGDRIWLEDPCCPVQRSLAAGRGLLSVPVPVDAEGMDAEAGRRLAPDARLALVMPGWQFPAGGTMSLRRRQALLGWVRRSGAWIVEDDGDGGLRYAGRPLPSLQGLDDSGRVLHLGGLDRTILPALRLSWLVLPPDLVTSARALRSRLELTVPLPEQMAVHDLLAEGHLASHLRRVRRSYGERQQALLDAAARRWAGALSVQAADAGLHVTARIDPQIDLGAAALEQAAAAQGLELPALSGYGGGDRRTLVLGYAAFTPERIARAADRLATVLDRMARPDHRRLPRDGRRA